MKNKSGKLLCKAFKIEMKMIVDVARSWKLLVTCALYPKIKSSYKLDNLDPRNDEVEPNMYPEFSTRRMDEDNTFCIIIVSKQKEEFW